MSGRVLFLDIDGVLNSNEWFVATAGGRATLSRIDEMIEMLEPRAIELLNELLRRAGPRVVLSSSWRIAYGLSFIQKAMVSRGWLGELADRTPTAPGGARGLQIQAWLDAQAEKPSSFVILDDNSDMGHLAHRLVQTTWARGLQIEHVERALEMFGVESI